MNNDEEYPRLILEEGFGKRGKFEMTQKGWFDATVEVSDGSRYTISFFDPGRLGQALVDAIRWGQPCLAESKLIVVPEVTLEAVQNSIRHLWETEFFAYLVPENPSHS